MTAPASLARFPQHEESPTLDAPTATEILEGVRDMVQSVLPDGTIRFANRAWRERLGYSDAELRHKNIFSIIHPESQEHCQHYFQRLMSGEDVGLMEVTFRAKSGEPVRLEGRVSVRFENGAPISTYGVFRETSISPAADAAFQRFREQRRLFHSVLSLLRANNTKDRSIFFGLVTSRVAQALGVARASIWLVDRSLERITCEWLHADGVSEGRTGQQLSRSEHPAYFEAIGARLPIRADDAYTHPATASFATRYLAPLGISSVLDGPIRVGDELAGVLCCEHTGPRRHWTNEEEEFLLAVSAIVLIFLESERRRNIEAEMQRLNNDLERTIEERSHDLRQSERRLQYLITSSPAVIYTCKPDGDFAGTYVSPNIEAMLGYPATAYLTDSTFWSDRVHPEDAPFAIATMRDAVRHGRSSYEYRFLHADGTYRWLRDSFILIRDEAGNPHEIVGSCVDIHDRRRAENEARAAANDLRRLIDTANAPIFGKDTRGCVNEWNYSAERLTGFSKADVMGRDLVDFVVDQFKPAVKRVLDRALSGIETANFEFPITTKDGRQVTVLLNAGTRKDADGRITGMVGVGQDITTLREADQRSLRAKRLESIGTLAGGVAHDINNALAPIVLASSMLRQQAPQSSQLIDMLEASARRGASMVQQLLTFAKGVDGARSPVESEPLLREIEKIVRSTFPKNIEIRVQCESGLEPVLGDSTQLHQVLLNLCVNARDAMPDGGVLSLRAARATAQDLTEWSTDAAPTQPYLRWTIADTGTGMTPEVVERLFEPFFSTKGPNQGTGLGLSTALGIVRSHGGMMRVESAPNAGSLFHVFLPIATVGADSAPPRKSPTTFRGQGETVLVVEDEPAIREIFEQILRNIGFTVRTATDGLSAVEILEREANSIALLLTDYHMPRMDGLALAKVVHTRWPTMQMVLASGRIDRSEWPQLAQLGFKALLDKPFDVEQLREALQGVLGSRR
jgi:two-component system cell cycle sensor histidine kinase/response regulator CckA